MRPIDLLPKRRCITFHTLISRCLRGPSLGSATSFPHRLPHVALAGRSLLAAGALPHHHRTLFERSLILQTIPAPVKIERLSDSDSGIIELMLDRGEANNAIGKEMLKGLRNALEVINGDSSANAVMICSSVPRVFCAGADLKERRQMGPSEVQLFVNSLQSTFSYLEALSIPSIAVIEGAALGGGLELVLSCDLRICGEDAMFSMPETGLAIIPGYVLMPKFSNLTSHKYITVYRAGGTQRLPGVVGRRRVAKELIFTGRRIDGKEALSLGLVNQCVPTGEAYKKALQIAKDIYHKGPLAIRVAKQAINQGMEVDMPSRWM